MRDRHQRRAGDRERLVAAEPGDQLAAPDRRDEDARHHRDEEQPRLGGAVPLDDLQVQRQERDRAEEREPDDEADQARRRERPVPEELGREDRLGGPPLDEREGDEQRDAEHRQADDLHGAPRPGRPAEAREEHDRREPAGEEHRAEVVDRVPHVLGGAVERDGDHRERGGPQRQVDVEDPPPREVLDEEAAEQRADHRRDAEDRAEEPLVLATLAGRDDVADHGHRRHDQPAAADALDRAERDQLPHVLREPAERRADRGRSRSRPGGRSGGRRGRRASRRAGRRRSTRAGTT